MAEWDGAESAEDLIGRADEALYRAKEQGRDCAVCEPSGEPSGQAGGNGSSAA